MPPRGGAARRGVARRGNPLPGCPAPQGRHVMAGRGNLLPRYPASQGRQGKPIAALSGISGPARQGRPGQPIAGLSVRHLKTGTSGRQGATERNGAGQEAEDLPQDRHPPSPAGRGRRAERGQRDLNRECPALTLVRPRARPHRPRRLGEPRRRRAERAQDHACRDPRSLTLCSGLLMPLPLPVAASHQRF
jgi:hypothetical protein